MNNNPLSHRLFTLGAIWKGIDGLLGIIGGCILFFTSSRHLGEWAKVLLSRELSHDPRDLVANAIIHFFETLSLSTRAFISMYLIIWGFVKIILVAALLKKKIWAYPLAETIIGIFILYQIYRFSITHSAFLFCFTLIDMLIMLFIGLEYKRIRARDLHDH